MNDASDRAAPPAPPAPPAPERSLLVRVRAAPITALIAAINVAWFLWAEHHGRTTENATLLRFGGVEPMHVWAGQYWRVASYMFLHVGWVHLAWNTYASVGWSASVERALGTWRFLVVYVLSGVAGGCVSAMFNPAVSAGASGAMFGIIGATLALRRRAHASSADFWQDPGTRATLLNIGIWTLIGLTAMPMNHHAHFGGLVAGFAATWLVTAKSSRLEWLVFALGFGSILAAAARPWRPPVGSELQALAYYGYAYTAGADGFVTNAALGRALTERACARGHMGACINEAIELTRANTPEGLGRAAELFRAACDGGEKLGCTQLAGAYRSGRGVPRDDARAAELFRSACDQGDAAACVRFGAQLLNGTGIARDDARAAELFRKGCAEGSGDGCAGVSYVTAVGRGVAKDRTHGLATLREQCSKGSAWACSLEAAVREDEADAGVAPTEE